MALILIVDDEPQIRRALRVNLEARSYTTVEAEDGRSALRTAADANPDVVLLDLGLPDLDGVDVVAGIRGWSQVPIIVLTARDDEHSKVLALDAGADDYVTKPFGINELLARIRASLRRVNPTDESPATITTDAFVIDLAAKRAMRLQHEPGGHDARGHDAIETGAVETGAVETGAVETGAVEMGAVETGAVETGAVETDATGSGATPKGERDVHLTPTEWSIVEYLVRHPDRLVTQRQIVDAVWGPAYATDANLIRVHLTHIRAKLEPEPAHPRYFVTEPGMGYRFFNIAQR